MDGRRMAIRIGARPRRAVNWMSLALNDAGEFAGADQALPEGLLGGAEPLNVSFVALHLEAQRRVRWAITPVVDGGQPRDGEDVLQLRKMMPHRTSSCGGGVVGRFAAFYFHRAFPVRGETVEARALPGAGDALHTGWLYGEAQRAAIKRPALPLARRTARLLEVPGGFLGRLLLF